MKLAPYVNLTVNRTWASMMADEGVVGIFRNSKQVLPGRWGVWICMGFGVLEIGSRNPQDRVGLFLRKMRLWPW